MKIVQFFALPTTRLEPAGEHQFAVTEDGRLFERFVYVNATPAIGQWREIPPPISNSPNVPVTP